MSYQAKLRFPNKSHRKIISIPKKSAALAEFIGIIMGDGGITDWQVTVTVNSSKDREYSLFVKSLFLKLFGLLPAIRQKKGKNALVIQVSGANVTDFLVSCGLNKGNKLTHGLKIPKWIERNSSYLKACIRGLVDTDGCLYIHKHTVGGKQYKNIGFCFTSASPILIRQMAVAFEQFGVMPHISKSRRDIFLYRAESIARYLATFGTSNERIRGIYEQWRDG